jgi:hypothetical protein
MLAYLAGPMTGYPEYNFPMFRGAANALREQGREVVSPVELDEEIDGFDGKGELPHHHEVYMRRDLPLLLKCDEVRVIDGWFDSKGAVSECLVATLAGIPIRTIAGKDVGVTATLLVGRLFALLQPNPPLTHNEALALYNPPPQVSTWKPAEATLARPLRDGYVPATWDDALDAVFTEMRSIMIERQAKYGPDNITRQGLLGVLTRAMDDKIERIKGALNGTIVRGRVVLDPIEDGSEANDTFEDGALDGANYIGPILVMLKRGWWTLPRKDKP